MGMLVRVAGSVVAACLAAGAGIAPAEAAETNGSGGALYRRYCGACHGPEGRGDGVASSLMRPAPTDLTGLAARHGGEFPMELVARTIDGREMPRAHGDPAMPVWGRILSEDLGGDHAKRPATERRVAGRIYLIAEYLRGIQKR